MRFYDDLDKAIERLSASKHANPECQADREQLREWLKELKRLRETSFDKDKIKIIIIQAMYERQDNSSYDWDENYIPDDSYDGWCDCIEFFKDKFGVEITDDDIFDFALSDEE